MSNIFSSGRAPNYLRLHLLGDAIEFNCSEFVLCGFQSGMFGAASATLSTFRIFDKYIESGALSNSIQLFWQGELLLGSPLERNFPDFRGGRCRILIIGIELLRDRYT
ncbi:hypothetical protein [Burkholderia sp. BE17]|uniref:hypothetical protein n=1 Tax=Burkholderia sp. BE17 TaxID=2656644 RepID=UPI00128E20B1|nr:hypothetical protein [Burkholderia sp. BE17]MPV66158.1 hypothetical protein [Burkholderia sp. BE17]